MLSTRQSSFTTHNPSLASHKFQSSSTTTAQQVSGRGRTRKVGDAKSIEDIVESIYDEVAEYGQQAKQDSTKDNSKLLKERYADVGVCPKRSRALETKNKLGLPL